MSREQESPVSTRRSAGAFDVRTIIALLFGIYGVVLVIMGIGFTSAADQAKAAGVNINLWAGIGMAIVSVLFLAWARLRPVVVPADDETAPGAADPGAGAPGAGAPGAEATGTTAEDQAGERRHEGG